MSGVTAIVHLIFVLFPEEILYTDSGNYVRLIPATSVGFIPACDSDNFLTAGTTIGTAAVKLNRYKEKLMLTYFSALVHKSGGKILPRRGRHTKALAQYDWKNTKKKQKVV